MVCAGRAPGHGCSASDVITPVTVETKVAAPAIATAVVSTLGGATYALVLSFGWFHPTAGQTAALAGMGAAVVYLVQVAVGYLAPHTPRADLSTSAVGGDNPTPKETGGLVVGSPSAPVVSAPDAAAPQVSGGNVQVTPEPAAAPTPPVAP